MTDLPGGRWVFVPRRDREGPSQVYTLRLPVAAVEQLRALADSRGEKHTSLARGWLLDRLAAEERLALDPDVVGRRAVAEAAVPYAIAGPRDSLAWVRDALGDLDALCADHGVRRIEVFGSTAQGGFRPGRSDVDLQVTFEDAPAGEKAERYLRLVEELERRLGTRVDLVDAAAVRNPFMKRAIERSSVTLHERA